MLNLGRSYFRIGEFSRIGKPVSESRSSLPSRLLLLIILIVPFLVVPSPGLASGSIEFDNSREDLERIERWLSSGDLDQAAAARRELTDRIGIAHIEQLNTFLTRPLSQEVRQPLNDRLRELIQTQLREVEIAIENFQTARQLARELAEQISREETPPSAQQVDSEDLETRRVELEERRRSRRNARERVDSGHDRLRQLGLTIAPVLFHRRETHAAGSTLIERFHRRLWEELEEEAQRLFPQAPAAGTISSHVNRALIPLIAALESNDPAGWQQIRNREATTAIDLLESLRPTAIDEGRSILLELGDASETFLTEWIQQPSPLPSRLQAQFHQWNRLRVPPGFERRTALDLGSYESLSRRQRKDLIDRLGFMGTEDVTAVRHGIVKVEEEVALKVEAAAILARLGDPRGAGFLRQLGLLQAVELEAISRRVLLIEALQLRDRGDEAAALNSLLAILRRYPADFRLHFEIAFSALRLRRLDLSIEHFERAIALDARDPLAHYNFACALALAGQSAAALDALEASIEAGFRDREHILADEDLESLRDLSRFKELVDALLESPTRPN